MSDSEKECIISIRQMSDKKEIEETDDLNLSPDTLTQEKSEILSVCSVHSQISNPLEIMRKLEIVKEIKNKTYNLQRIKTKLSQDVESIESEDKSMIEFKSELELLHRERLSLIDELRQIDSDISTVEKTIKHSEDEKRRALDSVKRLNSEYRPLKHQINQLRELVGLTKESNDDEMLDTFLRKLTTDKTLTSAPKHNLGIDRLINEKPKLNKSTLKSANDFSNEDIRANMDAPISAFKPKNSVANHTSFYLSKMDLPVQLATAALMAHSLRNRSSSPSRLSTPTLSTTTTVQPHQITTSQQIQLNHAFQQQQQNTFDKFILNQMSLNDHSNLQIDSIPSQQQSTQSLHQLPQFRQQPPPMKSCLSCNQQIHRNAPICPLCKAKSRSRNPKKPKKKIFSLTGIYKKSVR